MEYILKWLFESCFCNFAINPQGKKNPINICISGKWTFFFLMDKFEIDV